MKKCFAGYGVKLEIVAAKDVAKERAFDEIVKGVHAIAQFRLLCICRGYGRARRERNHRNSVAHASVRVDCGVAVSNSGY